MGMDTRITTDEIKPDLKKRDAEQEKKKTDKICQLFEKNEESTTKLKLGIPIRRMNQRPM